MAVLGIQRLRRYRSRCWDMSKLPTESDALSDGEEDVLTLGNGVPRRIDAHRRALVHRLLFQSRQPRPTDFGVHDVHTFSYRCCSRKWGAYALIGHPAYPIGKYGSHPPVLSDFVAGPISRPPSYTRPSGTKRGGEKVGSCTHLNVSKVNKKSKI